MLFSMHAARLECDDGGDHTSWPTGHYHWRVFSALIGVALKKYAIPLITMILCDDLCTILNGWPFYHCAVWVTYTVRNIINYWLIKPCRNTQKRRIGSERDSSNSGYEHIRLVQWTGLRANGPKTRTIQEKSVEDNRQVNSLQTRHIHRSLFHNFF